MRNADVTILCSGVALGVYIPALLVDYQLGNRGFVCDVAVIERYLTCDKRRSIFETKKAFHQNFRVAIAGQKLSRDLWPLMDLGEVDRLFDKWASECRKRFIVFSGFWMSLIREYSRRFGYNDLEIDIIHMDADISTSWEHFEEDCERYNNIWLFRWNDKTIPCTIPVKSAPPIAFDSREQRFIIHGGGWGMGTYQSKISELEMNGLMLDTIAYDISETQRESHGCKYYMIDPAWIPWEKDAGSRHTFPPFGEIGKNGSAMYQQRREYHEMYDLLRKDLAIISKPGGATLLDSLSSATPIVMLEPFGEYERKNAELWKSLGFGVYYDEWKRAGFSIDVIRDLHDNLMKIDGTVPMYTDGKICGYTSVSGGERCMEVTVG